jgi:hypothetical protein
MMAPTLAYLLTWIGLSFWYFAYWNQYPSYTKVFAGVGTAILVIELILAAFFPTGVSRARHQ